jgi:hypothetical protein
MKRPLVGFAASVEFIRGLMPQKRPFCQNLVRLLRNDSWAPLPK